MNNEYDYNEFPLAYLITLRTYGTWLHGDKKLSVDRKFNRFGTPRMAENEKLQKAMTEELKQEAFLFDEICRKIVENTIKEVCVYRGYDLQTLNVRSNHIHAVISAQIEPKLIVQSLKSYSTRKLRENNLINENTKVWSRGASKRYLWKPKYVSLAVEYVLYAQGDIIPDITDCPEIFE